MTIKSECSRRQFLKNGFKIIGSALAMPYVIDSSALGRDGKTPPSERITMGFIGLGHQGGGHLFGGAWTYLTGGYLGRKDVQVLGVCDLWPHKREKARARINAYYADIYGKGQYQACTAYQDALELLARPDIDAVNIALPIHWHAPMAIRALKAGKDVYCEKPTAVTIRESQAVLEAARRYGCVYQAGTQQRSEYGGRFRRACALVRSGRIGRLKSVYAYGGGGGITWKQTHGQVKPIPDGFDWDRWIGPAPSVPYDGNLSCYRWGYGNINWGQHHYDFVQWVLDADRTGPVALDVEEGRAVYTYNNGVVVHGRPYPGESVGGSGGACFVGTEGRIVVDRQKLVSYPPDIAAEPILPHEVQLYVSHSHAGNFLECIRSRKRTICDAHTAHRAISVVLLGGIIQQLKRPLKWDPELERFIDDDEANRMLSVAKRLPWCI